MVSGVIYGVNKSGDSRNVSVGAGDEVGDFGGRWEVVWGAGEGAVVGGGWG